MPKYDCNEVRVTMEENPLPQPVTKQEHESKTTSKKKEKVENLFLKSDLHGIPDWYEARSGRWKIMWSIILFVAITILIIELIRTAIDFKDNPIITTYSLISDPGQLPFPEIYLCPSNPIHAGQRKLKNVVSDWEKENVAGLLGAYANQSALSGILAMKSTISQALVRFQQTYAHEPPAVAASICPATGCPTTPEPTTTTQPPPWIPEDVQDYFLQVGYPINTFFNQCSFNSIEVRCQDIVEEVFDGDYGKCFIVRPPKSDRIQRAAGVGLSLVLSLDWGNSNNLTDPHLYDGIVMKVSQNTDIGSQQFNFLSPGQYIRTSLEATKLNLIERKRSKGGQSCIEMEEGINNLTHLTSSVYSSGICYKDCQQKIVIDKCSCVLPVDKSLIKGTTYPLCNVNNLTKCAYPALNQNNKTLTNCATWCKVPCNLWKFTVDTSMAKFPSDAIQNSYIPPASFPTAPPPSVPPTTPTTDEPFTDDLPQTPPDPPTPPPTPPPDTTFMTPPPLTDEQKAEKAKQEEAERLHDRWKNGDMLILDVAYSTLQYIEITQAPSMTFTTFVSNIGGQCGLWVGASVIAIIKFVILLCPICAPPRKHRRTSIENNN